jgi:hypothetical protein
VHLKIPPQFQASWQHRLFTLDMGSLKKMTPFPFTFLILFYKSSPGVSDFLKNKAIVL